MFFKLNLLLLLLVRNIFGQTDPNLPVPEIADHIKVSHYLCEKEGFKKAKLFSVGEISKYIKNVYKTS